MQATMGAIDLPFSTLWCEGFLLPVACVVGCGTDGTRRAAVRVLQQHQLDLPAALR
jgi:hypothetical protein